MGSTQTTEKMENAETEEPLPSVPSDNDMNVSEIAAAVITDMVNGVVDQVANEKSIQTDSEVAPDSWDATRLYYVNWVGKPVRLYYNAVVYENKTYKVGDHVYLHHTETDVDETPFIAQIHSFFETQTGRKLMRTKWYYRPEDTKPTKVSQTAHKRELYASEEYDDNPIGCVKGHCYVSYIEDIEDFEAWVQSDDHFFYQKSYSSKTNTWSKVETVPIHLNFSGLENQILESTPTHTTTKKSKKTTTESPARNNNTKKSDNNNKSNNNNDNNNNNNNNKNNKNYVEEEGQSSKKQNADKVVLGPVIEIIESRAKRRKSNNNNNNEDKRHEWVEYEGHRYHRMDHVILRPNDSGDKPYVALILDILSIKGEALVNLRWYFDFKELSLSARKHTKKTEREIYASPNQDTNPVGTIIGPCQVRKFDKIDNLDEYLAEKETNFFYRKWYDSEAKSLRVKPPADVIVIDDDNNVGDSKRKTPEKKTKKKEEETKEKKEKEGEGEGEYYGFSIDQLTSMLDEAIAADSPTTTTTTTTSTTNTADKIQNTENITENTPSEGNKDEAKTTETTNTEGEKEKEKEKEEEDKENDKEKEAETKEDNKETTETKENGATPKKRAKKSDGEKSPNKRKKKTSIDTKENGDKQEDGNNENTKEKEEGETKTEENKSEKQKAKRTRVPKAQQLFLEKFEAMEKRLKDLEEREKKMVEREKQVAQAQSLFVEQPIMYIKQ